MLDFIEKKAKTQTEHLVIFLHGYGSNERDLMSLSDEFDLPYAHFISVRAPFKCESGFGYQWFGLNDRSEDAMYNNLQPATKILDEFITQQLARFNFDETKLILAGFSQGTMMALHTAPRRHNPCIVIGYSGMLIKGSMLYEAKSKPKILLIHGEDDEVIPPIAFDISIKYLSSNDFLLEHHLIRNLAHNINREVVNISKKFLKENFK